MYFEFMLNGSAKTRNLVYSRSSVSYRTASNLIVLQLSLGDRVWIRMNRGGSHFSYGAGGDQSFSGFLLWYWLCEKNLNCCLTKGLTFFQKLRKNPQFYFFLPCILNIFSCNEYAHLLLTVSVNIYLTTTYIYFF